LPVRVVFDVLQPILLCPAQTQISPTRTFWTAITSPPLSATIHVGWKLALAGPKLTDHRPFASAVVSRVCVESLGGFFSTYCTVTE
jgi:hypothetical protein